MRKRICVYCGSHIGQNGRYREAAVDLGRLLAARDLGLVYGGGHVGLMGIIADAALAGGGEVIGVIPEQLRQQEVAHDNLSELHIVADMHERKALMATLADGFIALPGGLGTLEELSEMLTWQQLGIHTKPIGLLNTGGYYDALLAFLDRAVADGYVRSSDRQRLQVADSAAALLELLAGDW